MFLKHGLLLGDAYMSFALRMLVVCIGLTASLHAADDPVFSGPQVGEKVTPFKVQGVYDAQAGQELDLVTAAMGKPLLLIFLHDLTRPSAGLMRALCAYAEPHRKKGTLHCGVVWLAADRSQAEQYLKQARQSLNLSAPVGISPDGAEGPGSYGLNRKVALTVLVVNDNRVTANFALVQPALTDAPRILADVAKLIDAPPPTLEDVQRLMGAPGGTPADLLRQRLRPLIQRDATAEEVQRAVAAVEEVVSKDKALQKELGQIAQRIVKSGNLKNYGTPAAQEHIQAWAKKYGSQE